MFEDMTFTTYQLVLVGTELVQLVTYTFYIWYFWIYRERKKLENWATAFRRVRETLHTARTAKEVIQVWEDITPLLPRYLQRASKRCLHILAHKLEQVPDDNPLNSTVKFVFCIAALNTFFLATLEKAPRLLQIAFKATESLNAHEVKSPLPKQEEALVQATP